MNLNALVEFAGVFFLFRLLGRIEHLEGQMKTVLKKLEENDKLKEGEHA